MNTTLPLVSPQMREILLLLEQEGPTCMREINGHLYRLASGRDRRILAASTSRTVRRMERRGLVVREGKAINVTGSGLIRLHPEILEQMAEEIRTAVRRGIDEAFAQC